MMLLRWKHWQVFLLLFATPILLQSFTLVYVVLYRQPVTILWSSAAVIMPFVILHQLWTFSIGRMLYRLKPPEVRINYVLFATFLILPVVLMLVLFTGMSIFIEKLMAGIDFTPALSMLVIGIMVPLNFFLVFSAFYTYYFNARLLKSIDLERNAEFSDYINEFVLFWFWPVGVWFLQPRINKLNQLPR